ncbi:MAG: DEAD/DEAH box helicase, partial [Pseudomonadota bacterium]
DIEKICSLLPPKRQTLLFSATMPKPIAKLAKTFQKDPVRIEVARQSQTADTIAQHVVKLPRGDDKAKRTALRRVIESREVVNGIVFCNRKREVDIVAKSLTKHGFSAAPIHGDLPQSERMKTLDSFRDGELQLLIASDVAARGLDVPDVGHVFNYAPPVRDEDYVHRIGRTGRAGRSGESFTLVAPDDEKGWRGVLGLIKKEIEEYMPDGLLDELEDLPKDEGRGRGRSRRGERSEGRGRRGRGRRDRAEESKTETKSEPAETKSKPTEKPPKSEAKPDRPKRERGKRDYKRADDDPILEPAPEGVTGFGEDVPAFLK